MVWKEKDRWRINRVGGLEGDGEVDKYYRMVGLEGDGEMDI